MKQGGWRQWSHGGLDGRRVKLCVDERALYRKKNNMQVKLFDAWMMKLNSSEAHELIICFKYTFIYLSNWYKHLHFLLPCSN